MRLTPRPYAKGAFRCHSNHNSSSPRTPVDPDLALAQDYETNGIALHRLAIQEHEDTRKTQQIKLTIARHRNVFDTTLAILVWDNDDIIRNTAWDVMEKRLRIYEKHY